MLRVLYLLSSNFLCLTHGHNIAAVYYITLAVDLDIAHDLQRITLSISDRNSLCHRLCFSRHSRRTVNIADDTVDAVSLLLRQSRSINRIINQHGSRRRMAVSKIILINDNHLIRFNIYRQTGFVPLSVNGINRTIEAILSLDGVCIGSLGVLSCVHSDAPAKCEDICVQHIDDGTVIGFKFNIAFHRNNLSMVIEVALGSVQSDITAGINVVAKASQPFGSLQRNTTVGNQVVLIVEQSLR